MSTPLTIKALLHESSERLAPVSDSPRLDAEVLLAHVLGKTRTYLHTWPERLLESGQKTLYRELVARRQAGEPIAYLTGTREFWSREFLVTPDVLIPRPETELLVELVLERIPNNRPCTIADLGIGSGAIAITIALERPQTTIIASDISAPALSIAKANAARLGAKTLEFVLSDWLDGFPHRCPLVDGTYKESNPQMTQKDTDKEENHPCSSVKSVDGIYQEGEGDNVAAAFTIMPQRFDMILSNPPYVAENDPHLAKGDLRFEPQTALASGKDGLDAIRRIAADARQWLKPGGLLLLEHGYDQADAVQKLLMDLGYTAVMSHKDLAGHARVTSAQAPAHFLSAPSGTALAAGPDCRQCLSLSKGGTSRGTKLSEAPPNGLWSDSFGGASAKTA